MGSSTSKPGRLPPPTASEAAFERLLAHFEDPDWDGEEASLAPAPRTAPSPTLRRSVPAAKPASKPASALEDDAEFLAALFASKAAYAERDRFASIGEADDFYTKIVGVSFEGRQNVVAGLAPGDPLDLVREAENPHDPNAIAVRYGRLALGYLRREIARRLAPNVDAGDRYRASVGSVTGGGDRHVGVNIRVRRERSSPVARPAGGDATHAADRANVDADVVRAALIGDRPLRDAQRSVLSMLDDGRNTLAILGTGRGKSLCFQVPAAQRALARGEKTLVFYPLRALANDQFEAMTRRLGPFGLRIYRANGAIDGGERAELEAALEDGSWDVILSTPEFATYHRDAFLRRCNRPSLVVVDEAHHIFESKHRAAYGTLGTLVRELGAAQVLALTATAAREAFDGIRSALAIDAWVIDPTVRENLHMVDARSVSDKNAYLARELGHGGKAIVYCNSRNEVAKLADRLRARFGETVAFYHAGIPGPERLRVEDLFRRGVVTTIVATSAFGEGIDLPDVRDVVLYHLNFNFTEFNQMAGRAGRDGEPARIHLLFGDADRRINDYIIAKSAPSLEVLRELYRGLRGLASFDAERGFESLRMTHEDVARTLDLDMVEGATVSAALRIFEEAGLVETGNDDDGRFVRFLEVSGKVDLTKTARFAEAVAEREAFDTFCGLALGADAETLEQIINRPIYPDRVPFEYVAERDARR